MIGRVKNSQTQINERNENKGKRKRIRVFTRKRSIFICLLRWLAGVLFGSEIIKFPLFSQFFNTNHFEIIQLKSIFIVFFFSKWNEKIKIWDFFQTNKNPGQYQTLTMEWVIYFYLFPQCTLQVSCEIYWKLRPNSYLNKLSKIIWNCKMFTRSNSPKMELVWLCGFGRVWWRMKNCILSLVLLGQVFWLP